MAIEHDRASRERERHYRSERERDRDRDRDRERDRDRDRHRERDRDRGDRDRDRDRDRSRDRDRDRDRDRERSRDQGRDRDRDRDRHERRRDRSPSPEERGRRRERATGFSSRLTQPLDGAGAATQMPGAAAIMSAVQSVPQGPQGAVDPTTQALLLQAMLQQQPQSSKSSRELYIGNLPAGGLVNETVLKEFLGQAVLQASLNVQPGNPIMQTRINGCYAFVEFRSVQECTNALSLRGIVLYNNELTVDRPMAYRGPPDGIVITWPTVMAARINEDPELAKVAIGLRAPGSAPAAPAAPGMPGALPGMPAAGLPPPVAPMIGGAAGPGGALNDPITKPSRELHIGNIPEGTQELELKVHLESIIQAAGFRDESLGAGPVVLQVRCSLKFAFAEFRSIDECTKCMMLDGSIFKGQPLRIQRPRAYVGPAGGPAGGMPPMGAPMLPGGGLPAPGLPPPPPPPPGVIPGPAALAPPPPPPAVAPPPMAVTNIIELSNMVTAGEVKEEQDVQDVVEDTSEEMTRYGPVQRIEVLRPPPGSPDDMQVFLFVEFQDSESASNAFKALQGRTFDGRIVGVRYIDKAEFDSRAAQAPTSS